MGSKGSSLLKESRVLSHGARLLSRGIHRCQSIVIAVVVVAAAPLTVAVALLFIFWEVWFGVTCADASRAQAQDEVLLAAGLLDLVVAGELLELEHGETAEAICIVICGLFVLLELLELLIVLASVAAALVVALVVVDAIVTTRGTQRPATAAHRCAS